MEAIYVVLQGGGSDEPLLGIFATREAAEFQFERDGSAHIYEYVLNTETNEFVAPS